MTSMDGVLTTMAIFRTVPPREHHTCISWMTEPMHSVSRPICQHILEPLISGWEDTRIRILTTRGVVDRTLKRGGVSTSLMSRH
jgi:hypothetical protein